MMNTNQRSMDYVTKDRIYKFSQDCSKSSLAQFMYRFFPKEHVDSRMDWSNIRTDTTLCYHGYYAVIIPFKSKDGKIRNVLKVLYNPETGMIVRDGDGDALIQHASKQNSRAGYESYPWGDKCYSIAKELAKGYRLEKTPTLFGMEKIYEADHICVVTSVVDALVMSIICPHYPWVATGYEGMLGTTLYHSNVRRELIDQNAQITIFPEIDGIAEAKEIQSYLLKSGIEAKVYPHWDYLKNCEYVGHRKSIATIALKMLEMQYSYSDIMLALRLIDESQLVPF